jgi:nitrate/nitrite transport system ATP-binding protein
MSFLDLKSVSKAYDSAGGRSQILENINLSIREGEFVSIVGYSGAGKTTLINTISGLVRPDEGSVTLNGVPITGPSPDRAIVFQNYSLLPWLNVMENVLLAIDQVYPKWSRSQRMEHAEKYVAMVNLTPARHKLPSELSGGMRQRVSVARALSMNPKVLLMDEPLSALDALTRSTLQDEIESIFRTNKTTVVLITNDVDEAILLADRIIPLSAGPAATLGPEVQVNLPRPRDRQGINHNPAFKQIRKAVFDYLLGDGRPGANHSAQKPAASMQPLPELKPREFGRNRKTAAASFLRLTPQTETVSS